MSRKAPPGAWKPGDPRASLAGKKSSRAIPEDLREARIENAKTFEATIYKYMHSPIDTLRAILKDPTTPARDLVVIRILVLAIEKGDHARLSFLLDRTIGRVTEKVEAKVVTANIHDIIIQELEKNK